MKYLNKIIEYGLYLIAFLLPVQTRLFLRSADLEYWNISLYGIDILVFIVILLYCYIALKQLRITNYELRVSKTWYLIVGLDLFIFISIFFAQDWLLALYRYGIFLLGVGLFWLITSANYNKAKLIWSFLLGLSLQAGLGIWQFLSQSSFANKWLGIAQHNSSDLGVSVVETLSGERWLRAYGGFDHPNVLGGAMVVGLLILIGLIIRETRKKKKETNKLQNINFNNIFLLSTFYFLLSTLLFSFSRSAWIAFAVGIILLLIFYLIQKNYLKQKKLLKLIFLSAILVFMFYNVYPSLFQARLLGETRLEMKSNQERIVSMQESGEIIKSNLFFGTGIGNYTLVLKQKYPDQEAWAYQPVHNTYLLILSEIGIFGFLFFVSCFLFLVLQNYKSKNYINTAMLVSVVTMMMFDHWWWSLHFGVLFFWFVLGVLYVRQKKV